MQRAHEAGWKNEYLFDRIERATHEFQAMMTYHQTSPDSPFTQRAIVSLAMREGRLTLSDSRFIRTQGSSRSEQQLDAERRRRVIAESFGLSAP